MSTCFPVSSQAGSTSLFWKRGNWFPPIYRKSSLLTVDQTKRTVSHSLLEHAGKETAMIWLLAAPQLHGQTRTTHVTACGKQHWHGAGKLQPSWVNQWPAYLRTQNKSTTFWCVITSCIRTGEMLTKPYCVSTLQSELDCPSHGTPDLCWLIYSVHRLELLEMCFHYPPVRWKQVTTWTTCSMTDIIERKSSIPVFCMLCLRWVFCLPVLQNAFPLAVPKAMPKLSSSNTFISCRFVWDHFYFLKSLIPQSLYLRNFEAAVYFWLFFLLKSNTAVRDCFNL